MKTQQIPHHKASGSKDELDTNWPVVITLLATMITFLVAFYFFF